MSTEYDIAYLTGHTLTSSQSTIEDASSKILYPLAVSFQKPTRLWAGARWDPIRRH